MPWKPSNSTLKAEIQKCIFSGQAGVAAPSHVGLPPLAPHLSAESYQAEVAPVASAPYHAAPIVEVAPVAAHAPVAVAPVAVVPHDTAHAPVTVAQKPHCVTHTEEQCHTTYDQVCDVQSQVCIQVTEQECASESQNVCIQVQETTCNTDYKDVCINTVESQCSPATDTILETRCQETSERYKNSIK